MRLLKDSIIQTIRRMPEDTTAIDIIYEIYFIDRELEKIKSSGEEITTEEFLKRIGRWDDIEKDEEDFKKFLNLVKKWKEETLLTSSVEIITSNQSYLEIIGMGKKVLPYIFQDLKSEPAFWFPALESITGFNPIKRSHIGIIKLMTEDWLKWGEENGYI